MSTPTTTRPHRPSFRRTLSKATPFTHHLAPHRCRPQVPVRNSAPSFRRAVSLPSPSIIHTNLLPNVVTRTRSAETNMALHSIPSKNRSRPTTTKAQSAIDLLYLAPTPTNQSALGSGRTRSRRLLPNPQVLLSPNNPFRSIHGPSNLPLPSPPAAAGFGAGVVSQH